MKMPLLFATLALSTLPVLAQSQGVSLLYTQLTPRHTTWNGLKTTTDKSSGFGLRYSHDLTTLSRLGNARLGFESTWVRETSTEKIRVEGTPFGDLLTYSHEYMGLGLAMTWTKVVDLGAALELRHESNTQTLKADPYKFHSSRSYTRPWISLRAGYTFVTSVAAKPFVALEYSLPLSDKTKNIGDGTEAMVALYGSGVAGNLNPKSQLTLNAGIRF